MGSRLGFISTEIEEMKKKGFSKFRLYSAALREQGRL